MNTYIVTVSASYNESFVVKASNKDEAHDLVCGDKRPKRGQVKSNGKDFDEWAVEDITEAK